MSFDHVVEHVGIFRNILVAPFNAYYVIHTPASTLPFVFVSSHRYLVSMDTHIRLMVQKLF